jgi:hypothetical protein
MTEGMVLNFLIPFPENCFIPIEKKLWSQMPKQSIIVGKIILINILSGLELLCSKGQNNEFK